MFRSARAPFAYEAMWAIAVTLERARPILSGWGMGLHDLGYRRPMVSQLFKEEAFEMEFSGPSVSGTVVFDTLYFPEHFHPFCIFLKFEESKQSKAKHFMTLLHNSSMQNKT